MFHFEAYKYDYQINVTQIDVEQNEDVPTNYYFTVYLDYEKIDGDQNEVRDSRYSNFSGGENRRN